MLSAMPTWLNLRRSSIPVVLGLALAACGGEPTSPPIVPLGRATDRVATVSSNETIVVTWGAAALEAIRVTKPGPPMCARILAIVHTSIYDAWAAYDRVAVGTRLGGTLRRPAAERTDANKRQAISYAAHRALVDLFPSQKPAFDAQMTALGYDPNNASSDRRTPAGVGNVAAQAVLDFRHRDGANQLGDLHPGAYSDYTGYTPYNPPDRLIDPRRWQPLVVNGVTQQFIAPHWGKVTPFALVSGGEFRLQFLAPNQQFMGGLAAAVDQLLATTANLGDREKVIAEYWADGPNSELPPGHWCLFGAFVSKRDHHTIDDDAKMFLMLGNALLDASISAWDTKRFYDSGRPITAIRALKAGQTITAWAGPGLGVRQIQGENWRPYQPANTPTPAFPEFVSGHSIFSAAAAEILRRSTGSDAFGASVTIPRGSGRVEPGLVPAQDLTLSWPTFSDAANEAGISRRYGGIHFLHGDLESRLVGRFIGALVWNKGQTYFAGTAR
jgi:hypothetical protein